MWPTRAHCLSELSAHDFRKPTEVVSTEAPPVGVLEEPEPPKRQLSLVSVWGALDKNRPSYGRGGMGECGVGG